MRILIVEDERALCDAIARSLRSLAYSVDCCHDGQEALDLLDVEVFDLLVLDLNLPRVDGMTVLRELRKTDCETKVLILSARGEVSDKVAGLDAGANDYLTKPFAGEELLARVRALARRQSEMVFDKISYCDITLDTSNYTLSCGQKSVSLGAKEYEIMRMFLSNPTQVISKDAIISKVWGLDVDITENNVEAYMSFLRKKLFFIGSKLTIMTKRLLGYYLEKESD